MNIFGKASAIEKAIVGLTNEIASVQETIETKQVELKEIQTQKAEIAQKEQELLVTLQSDLDLKLKKESQIEILKSI